MPDAPLARDELTDGCAILTYRDPMDPAVIRTVLVLSEGEDGSQSRGVAINRSERAAAVAHEEAVQRCREQSGQHPHQVLFGVAPPWVGGA
jgi:glutamine cyclotransferase